MIWNKPRILKELRRLNKSGVDLSYNALTKKRQPLVSAAAYHFGSYRKAVSAAGIDYGEISRRPRWTKPKIIQLIKQAKRRGDELHWSAVTRRRDELGKAAFASLQRRLFGQWNRAIHAAGLDADEIGRYRKWDRHSIIFEFKSRAAEQEPLNSGAMQREDSGLHAAAVRHFGSYDQALRAARLNPDKVRCRRRWTKAKVLRAIKQAKRDGQALSDSAIRRDLSALHGAAIRHFGSFAAARRAAGIKWTNPIKK